MRAYILRSRKIRESVNFGKGSALKQWEIVTSQSIFTNQNRLCAKGCVPRDWSFRSRPFVFPPLRGRSRSINETSIMKAQSHSRFSRVVREIIENHRPSWTPFSLGSFFFVPLLSLCLCRSVSAETSGPFNARQTLITRRTTKDLLSRSNVLIYVFIELTGAGVRACSFTSWLPFVRFVRIIQKDYNRSRGPH